MAKTMKEQVKINLGPIAKSYAAGGFPCEQTPEDLAARYKDHPDQKTADLYALLVPVIGNVVDLALQQKDEPEDVNFTQTYSSKITSFRELQQWMNGKLTAAAREYLENNTPANSDALQILATERSGSVIGLVAQGIGTGTKAMSQTLRRIPELYQRKHPEEEIDEKKLIQVARNNYRFVAELARLHVVHLVDVAELGGNLEKYNPRFRQALLNTELDDKDNLYFTDRFFELVPVKFEPVRTQDKWGERATIGCPALYSRAMRSLWEWHLEIAESIYRAELPEYKKC